MSYFNFSAYFLFALVTSITPGPNNFLLFSHGKNFGFKDSGKLMLGIMIGFLIMLYAAGYGIAEIITSNLTAAFVLKILGSAWLIYMAVVLRKIDSTVETGEVAPIGIWKVIIMQFVNVKAWIMAISGASAFLPHGGNNTCKCFCFFLIVCTHWNSLHDNLDNAWRHHCTFSEIGKIKYHPGKHNISVAIVFSCNDLDIINLTTF